MALSPEQITLAMSSANADLKFLMDREGVSLNIQSQLYHAGVVKTQQFAAFVADVDELRKTLKEDFNLDPTGNLANRIELSKVVVAWESAKGRSVKMTEIEADSEAREQAKPIRIADFKAMRDAYQAKYWKLDAKQVPAKHYVEKISEGVERSEPKAEPLTEVLNYEDAETDVLKAVWDVGGDPEGHQDLQHRPALQEPRGAEVQDHPHGACLVFRRVSAGELQVPARGYAPALAGVLGLPSRRARPRPHGEGRFRGGVLQPSVGSCAILRT